MAATLVERILNDFATAPRESAAYRTARKFLAGGECSHLVCRNCVDPKKGWRSGECPPKATRIEALPPTCECGHGWESHYVATFDWAEYRDTLAGAAGVHLPDVEDP